MLLCQHNNIEELIEKLKRVYAPEKSVYQLQVELSNTFMWEKEMFFIMLLELKKFPIELNMPKKDKWGGLEDGPRAMEVLVSRLIGEQMQGAL